MNFRGYILREKESMERLLHRYEVKVQALPDVKFYPKNDGDRKRYYITTSEYPKEKYIGWKNNSEMLRSLLERENANKKISLVKENLHWLDQILAKYNFEYMGDGIGDSREIPLRGRRHFPESQNPYKREKLIHDTGLGFYTRTKSEAIVARRLYAYGIRFEYERKLRIIGLDGRWKSIYPDFTIWLDDGRVIYLEHVGMLQDEKYRKRFAKKAAEYHKNNLLISRDLFITMDGPDGDIDIKAVDALIRSF